MPYEITKSDNTTLLTVADRTVQSVAGGGVRLLGKNYGSYGEIIAENFVHMVENFASATAPTGTGNNEPLNGQLWFDTSNQVLNVRVDDGTDTSWLPIGGLFLDSNATGISVTPILDSDGNEQPVIMFKVNGIIVVIISASQFTPADPVILAAFPTIKRGVNINSTQSGGDALYKLRGRAVEAEFADLAEIYFSDVELVPGNLVAIGGTKEITKTTKEFDDQVFGIVSTEPGFLLNSSKAGQDAAYPVALKGRVPCLVAGPVAKGQRIVASATPGVGMAMPADKYNTAAIVGRALADKTSDDVGLVEVAVGVK